MSAGHSHLVRRRPSWLAVVVDLRYKLRAAADSFITEMLVPMTVLTMGASPWALVHHGIVQFTVSPWVPVASSFDYLFDRNCAVVLG